MTVFAGVIELSGKKIPEDTVTASFHAFRQSCCHQGLSLRPSEHVLLLSHNVVPEDTASTLQDGAHSCSVMAGDALFNNDSSADPLTQLQQVQGATSELTTLLSSARGVFSGARYNKDSAELTVFTDKSGIRPVFYYQHGDLLFFASLRGFFEHLPAVNLEFDFTHLCESMAMGFCLSNKTVYQGLTRLGAGECLRIHFGHVELHTYWDWKNIPSKETVTDADVVQAYDAFKDAVHVRLDDSPQALAFLSGGLDSRAICAQVSETGTELLTFNFATERSKDNEFARLYADQAPNVIHHQKKLDKLYFPNWSQLVADVIPEQADKLAPDTAQHKVWSGDGGSVAVGGVYITDTIKRQLANRDVKGAVEHFLNETMNTIPVRFIKPEYHPQTTGLINEVIAREFTETPKDTTKAMYHFLMDNDQKRHLEHHFETICEHGIELSLPFFDSDFLTHMYALPTDELINHKFYMRWFELFPKQARNTPWQTYPGHEKCPVAFSGDLSTQWDKKKRTHTRRLDFGVYLEARRCSAFKTYFNETQVALAMALHCTGVKDFTYLVKVLKDVRGFKGG
jgi:asparagine synthase (glutamine-hydrolysing)